MCMYFHIDISSHILAFDPHLGSLHQALALDIGRIVDGL